METVLGEVCTRGMVAPCVVERMTFVWYSWYQVYDRRMIMDHTQIPSEGFEVFIMNTAHDINTRAASCSWWWWP